MNDINWKEVFTLLGKIGSVASRNEKLKLLSENTSELVLFVLDSFLNPNNMYGVRDFDDISCTRCTMPSLQEVRELKDKLVKRQLTGNAARKALQDTILVEDTFCREWFIKMFQRDLKIGLSGISVNKICPGLIPEFKVGLCGGYDFISPWLEGEWIIEPKLDGLRCLAFVKDGRIDFVSRNGKLLYNLDRIEQELRQHVQYDCVIDGEIMAEDWNKSMTAVRSAKTCPSKELMDKVRYYVFDVLTWKEWETKKSAPLIRRKDRLEMLASRGVCPIIGSFILPTVVTKDGELDTKKYVSLKVEELLSAGYEGAVLKDLGAEYPFGRGDCWRKCKPIVTFDLLVVDVLEGSGRNKGRLGALVVLYKGKKVHVGGGYSDEQRNDFWERRKEMIDKIVEVKCQEVTKDNSLRFPVFLGVREDKDTVNEEKVYMLGKKKVEVNI